jgi:hypothetical protein
MPSSIASTSSSVSFRGEEIDVSDALDMLFKDLQENLNHCHCSVRQLAQCEERADTFMEAAQFDFEIQDYVEGLTGLFKELKQVSKDVLGKPPPEYKSLYSIALEKRKADKLREKEEAKMANQLEKMQMEIISE